MIKKSSFFLQIYGGLLVLGIFIIILSGSLFTPLINSAATFSILSSIIMASIGFFLVLFFRPSIVKRDEEEVRESVSRIPQLIDNFKKNTEEMKNIISDIENDLSNRKNTLENLENKLNEMTSEENDLKSKIQLLENTKPEVMKYIVEELGKRDKRSAWRDFALFLLGVITPVIISFLNTHFLHLY